MNNIEISEKLLNGFNQANWDAVRECLADNVNYDEKATGRHTLSAEDWINNSKGWKTAFSNAHGTILNRVEQGDTVVEEIMWKGTHDGEMLTPEGNVIPATHKSMENPAIMVSKFKNGKVVETRHYFDMRTMLTQLGLNN